jgi:Fe-S oxidoreductase/FAD/FMN-containing dehydrogenase
MELTSQQRRYLQDIFGDRINFEKRERQLYSSDVAALPGLLSGMAGHSEPAAIVQPRDEDELVQIAVWAQNNKIPLIARGKATSGYGGTVPFQGGMVVEFNRMRKIMAIDTGACSIKVQPGAVWEDIDRRLRERGLTLKSYPTSYPASTAAGWLATGGAGIGSYEAGYFRDSVLQVRLVQPDGEIKVLSGEDLDLVVNASGISGFISSIEFRVMPLEKLEVQAFAFDQASAAAQFIEALYEEQVPLWSLSFSNPEAARYRNRMPLNPHHGPGRDRLEVPEQFIVLAAYWHSSSARELLGDMAAKHGGALLDDETALHEWENRFSPMKAKRLGPSLIPAEVVVPASGLAAVLHGLQHKIALPLLLEGFAVRGKELVLLGFIPHDERKLGFNAAFGLSLTVLKIALQNGGRPYGLGMYFSAFAPQLLGVQTVESLKSMKKRTDPAGIMNPGKTIDTTLLARAVRQALSWEGVITAVANRFPGNPPAEHPRPQSGLPAEVAWLSYTCSSCGYCVDSCDQYYGRGWESQSPRGKWRLLKMVAEGKTRLTQADVSTFLACTTCETCNARCQLEMPIEPAWMTLRGQLVEEKGFHSLPAFHIMEASARKEWNIWARYAKDRDAWLPDDLRSKIKDRAEIAYFPGCTSAFVEQDVALATARLLDKAGIEFTYLGKEEACCGIPMLMAGRWDAWEAIMDHNIELMKSKGVKTIVTSCPACRLVWETYYKRWMLDRGEQYHFTAKHYSEVLAEQIAAGRFEIPETLKGRFTYHDPCHMGRASGVYEAPRRLIQAIPGIDYQEMEFNRSQAHCCGSVMTLVADPEAAARIGQVRLNDAQKVQAQTIITACPCCRFQLQVSGRVNNMDIQVRDLATVAARACGYDIPDSEAVMERDWVPFDIMIRMLNPRGMADMMAEMMDDLIQAMPGPMAGMMKWLRSRKPALKKPLIAAMKPVMPRLFPILLPGMLPRVMPKMLEMVKAKVSMPDFMAEQMPDLMPPAMADLMPKMLPDIIPYFMPHLESYLQAENKPEVVLSR